MTWTEAVTNRDTAWDAWALENFGVAQWEQLEPQQLHDLVRAMLG